MRRPQNVKNTATSIPEAAAVVARMSVGHALSRVPDQATIVIFLGCAGSLIVRYPSTKVGFGIPTRHGVLIKREILPKDRVRAARSHRARTPDAALRPRPV